MAIRQASNLSYPTRPDSVRRIQVLVTFNSVKIFCGTYLFTGGMCGQEMLPTESCKRPINIALISISGKYWNKKELN